MNRKIICPFCKLEIHLDENDNKEQKYINCWSCNSTFLNPFFEEYGNKK